MDDNNIFRRPLPVHQNYINSPHTQVATPEPWSKTYNTPYGEIKMSLVLRDSSKSCPNLDNSPKDTITSLRTVRIPRHSTQFRENEEVTINLLPPNSPFPCPSPKNTHHSIKLPTDPTTITPLRTFQLPKTSVSRTSLKRLIKCSDKQIFPLSKSQLNTTNIPKSAYPTDLTTEILNIFNSANPLAKRSRPRILSRSKPSNSIKTIPTGPHSAASPNIRPTTSIITRPISSSTPPNTYSKPLFPEDIQAWPISSPAVKVLPLASRPARPLSINSTITRPLPRTSATTHSLPTRPRSKTSTKTRRLPRPPTPKLVLPKTSTHTRFMTSTSTITRFRPSSSTITKFLSSSTTTIAQFAPSTSTIARFMSSTPTYTRFVPSTSIKTRPQPPQPIDSPTIKALPLSPPGIRILPIASLIDPPLRIPSSKTATSSLPGTLTNTRSVVATTSTTTQPMITCSPIIPPITASAAQTIWLLPVESLTTQPLSLSPPIIKLLPVPSPPTRSVYNPKTTTWHVPTESPTILHAPRISTTTQPLSAFSLPTVSLSTLSLFSPTYYLATNDIKIDLEELDSYEILEIVCEEENINTKVTSPSETDSGGKDTYPQEINTQDSLLDETNTKDLEDLFPEETDTKDPSPEENYTKDFYPEETDTKDPSSEETVTKDYSPDIIIVDDDDDDCIIVEVV